MRDFGSDKQKKFPTTRAIQKWNARSQEIMNPLSVGFRMTKLNGSYMTVRVLGYELGSGLPPKYIKVLQTYCFPNTIHLFIKNLKIGTFQLLRTDTYQNHLK